MATLRLSLLAKTSRLTCLADLIDAGGSSGATLCFYDGAQPPSPDVAITDQVALADIACPHPFAATIANGALVANPFDSQMGLVAGDATFCRLYNEAGDSVADLTVGLVASGANVEVSNTMFLPGVIIVVQSVTIIES